MFQHIVVVCLIVCILNVSADSEEIVSNPHIVGGKDANIRDHPYIVSIRLNGHHFCGGSIYSSEIIITAAHCLVDKTFLVDSLTISAGSTYLFEKNAIRSVGHAVLHPLYSQEHFDYDVAVLFLKSPLVFNDNIKPIELAKSRPPTGASVMVSGWGYIYDKSGNSQRLQETVLKIVNNTNCEGIFKTYFSKRMLCAREDKKDACQNDSGGPLTYENKLLGIVSYGVGCATKYPGVYTSIPNILDWISDVTEELN